MYFFDGLEVVWNSSENHERKLSWKQLRRQKYMAYTVAMLMWQRSYDRIWCFSLGVHGFKPWVVYAFFEYWGMYLLSCYSSELPGCALLIPMALDPMMSHERRRITTNAQSGN